jgi:hypothetical protein
LSGNASQHDLRIWGSSSSEEVNEHRRENPELNVFHVLSRQKVFSHMDSLVQEANGIQLHPSNCKKGTGFPLSQSLYVGMNIINHEKTLKHLKEGPVTNNMNSNDHLYPTLSALG